MRAEAERVFSWMLTHAPCWPRRDLIQSDIHIRGQPRAAWYKLVVKDFACCERECMASDTGRKTRWST